MVAIIEQNDVHINMLPVEVLSSIFSFLSLADAKQVRLTCKLWYSGCNRLSLLKNVKFVFRTGYSIQSISDNLLNRMPIHMNLEFQGLPVNTFSAKFWKLCGNNIYSIELHECTATDKTIKNIFTFCRNLREFKFVKTSDIRADLSEVFCSFQTLDKLIVSNIRHKKLKTFEIVADGVSISRNFYEKAFQLFPCINRLNVGGSSFNDLFYICTYIHGFPQNSCFTRIDKYLVLDALKELVFNIPSDCSWSKSLIEATNLKYEYISLTGLHNFSKGVEFTITLHYKRLKLLETIYVYSSRNYRNFLRFIERQKELSVLHLSVVEISEDEMKPMLFQILKHCHKLKELRFCYQPLHLHLDMAETIQFFNLIQHLEYLELSNDFYPDQLFPLTQPLCSYKLLHTLRLESNVSEECQIAMINYFVNLRNLELSFVTDRVLQAIFKLHTQLESLILWEIDGECSDYGFTGTPFSEERSLEAVKVKDGYSISSLKNLKHLELEGFCTKKLTEKFLMELEFEFLEYLELCLIDMFSSVSEKVIAKLANDLPRLKVAIFDDTVVPGSKLKLFCKNSKSLYRLVRIIGDDADTVDVKELFAVCPTLRLVSDNIENTFVYNPFTKKTQVKPSRDFKVTKKFGNEHHINMINFITQPL